MYEIFRGEKKQQKYSGKVHAVIEFENLIKVDSYFSDYQLNLFTIFLHVLMSFLLGLVANMIFFNANENKVNSNYQ